MGLGKTYSADYLIDSNGNTGVSGQVLISTATGIDWADGTAITGGPFLPLSAGSSYPLTNSLYLENTSGSAGASPSLYFKNGSGNFWRYLHESGGNFSIKEGTATRLTFKAGGNVGIGTTDPSAKLHVHHTSEEVLRIDSGNTGAIHFFENTTRRGIVGYSNGTSIATAADAGDMILRAESGSKLHLAIAGTSRLTVASGGNVGIGTTSPAQKLDVVGKMKISDDIILAQTNGRIDYDNGVSTGALRFWSTNGNAERMRITSAGNVGIGTASPARKLHVSEAGNGNIALFTNAIDADLNINLTSGVTMLTPSTALLAFGTSSSERMRIDGSGNVGIGTTSPVDELHVEGVIQSKKQLLPSTSSTAGWYKIGTMSGFVQGGATAVLEIAGHQGYNATNNQDYLIKLFIKTSNGNAGGPNGQGFNSWYERTGGNNATIEFKWNNSATNDYDLYMFIPTHSLRSWYSVKKGTGTWEHAGTSATDPGANSSTVLKATGLFNILDANVGIGTTSPAEKLNIYTATGRNFKVNQSTANVTIIENDYELELRSGGGYDLKLNANGSSTYGNVTFRTDGSERMRITSSGNVGIGTTAPDAPLHILKAAGGANIVAGLKLDPDDATANSGISIDFNASTTNTGASLVGSRIVGAREGGNASGFLALYTSPDASGSVPLERMRITSGGNVGIGTTSPGSLLEVHKDSASGQFATYRNNTGFFLHRTYADYDNDGAIVEFQQRIGVDGNYSRIGNYSNHPLYLMTNNSTNMTLLTNGNVGIGTTDPAAKLDVVVSNVSVTPNTDSSAVFRKNGHNYISILSGGTNEGGVIFGNSADAADGYIAYKHGTGAADQAFVFGTANGERMRITAAGTVGIGKTNPTHALDVDGAVRATSGALYGLRVHSNSGITASSNYMNFFTSQSNGWSFNANGTGADNSQVVRIALDGKVGIGATSPAAKLDVNGDIAVKGASIINKASAALTIGDIAGNDSVTNLTLTTAGRSTEVFLDDSGNVGVNTATPSYNLTVDSGANDIGIVTASSDSGSYVGFLDNATSTIPKVGAVGNKLILDASQYVGVRKTNPSYALDVNGTIRATGNVIAYSDARVKENVETIPNALDKVKSMRGVGYNKIGEEKRSIGVIAQEMLEVMPEVVSQDEQGMYSVAYGNLVGVLIEAVKEQQQQIDELKKQIK